MKFRSVVQEEMSFKDISYLELWWPICFVEWNHCAISVKSIMRNNSVKLFWINLNLDQWFRRRCRTHFIFFYFVKNFLEIDMTLEYLKVVLILRHKWSKDRIQTTLPVF